MRETPKIIIGCSCYGREAVEYLVPRLNLKNLVTIILPHIEEEKIFSRLNGKLPVKVEAISHNTPINKGIVYIKYDHSIKHYSPSINFKDNKFYIDAYTIEERISYLGLSPDKIPESMDIDLAMVQKSYSIDYIMTAAAKEFKESCVGVILSGAGVDGSKGIRLIKKHNGIILAQTRGSIPEYYEDMPKAAIATGCVDYHGTLDELAIKINQLVNKKIVKKIRNYITRE